MPSAIVLSRLCEGSPLGPPSGARWDEDDAVCWTRDNPSTSVILGRVSGCERRPGSRRGSSRNARLCYTRRMRRIEPVTYILASGRNGTLYVGVTANLILRMMQHRDGTIDGFTKRYGVTQLVYVEWYGTLPEAIAREKQLKKLSRARKIALIEQDNPTWRDLFDDFAGQS